MSLPVCSVVVNSARRSLLPQCDQDPPNAGGARRGRETGRSASTPTAFLAPPLLRLPTALGGDRRSARVGSKAFVNFHAILLTTCWSAANCRQAIYGSGCQSSHSSSGRALRPRHPGRPQRRESRQPSPVPGHGRLDRGPRRPRSTPPAEPGPVAPPLGRAGHQPRVQLGRAPSNCSRSITASPGSRGMVG